MEGGRLAAVASKSSIGKALSQQGVNFAAQFALPQKFPQATMITSIVASLLFVIVYARALAKNTGRECGRGWIALMMLPFVVGIIYIFFGKFIAYKKKVMYVPDPVNSMLLFSITAVALQYFASAFLIARHTKAPIGAAFKKALLSLIFISISCALTIISFVVFRYIVQNSRAIRAALKVIPVYGWIVNIVIKVVGYIWWLIDQVPILKKLYTTWIHFLPAIGFGNFIYIAWIPIIGILLSPIALFIPFTPLAALGGHGMACEKARAQYP